MQNHSPERLEIFLALALKSGAKQNISAQNIKETSDEIVSEALANEDLPAIFNYLSEKESEKFRKLQANYQTKSAEEKAEWRSAILQKIGTDEQLIDDAVHWSYVGEALRNETTAVQKIIFDFLPSEHRKTITFSAGRTKENYRKSKQTALHKTIRRTFSKQFVALRDLPRPTAFDRLNGAQLARLIRLTGIREVALACLQIEAVELVAAFLRRFSAEDTQAIAAQLNTLPKMSEERLDFAQNLVQTMIEAEPDPSAMLDLLGIHLTAAALCESSPERVAYTNQKMPLEVSAQLPEMIAEQRVETPENLRGEISAEIEQTAQTIYRSPSGRKLTKS